MRILTIIMTTAALGAATPVLAQNAPAKNNSAVKDAHTVNDGGAQTGASSFTRAQAREHIAKSGFTNVSALTKDANGVWRGTARKSGHAVHVALDFKGNVSTGM
jgi:putative membrane protein